MRDRLLVAGQLILLALLAVAPRLPWDAGFEVGWLRWLGWGLLGAGGVIVVVSALHLGDALTAVPTPKDGAALRTSGLYQWVRHPIYSGLLAIGWGLALVWQLWIGLVLAALLSGLLGVKARYEERLLAGRHPGYGEYRERTPRFVPGPWRRRVRGPGGSSRPPHDVGGP